MGIQAHQVCEEFEDPLFDGHVLEIHFKQQGETYRVKAVHHIERNVEVVPGVVVPKGSTLIIYQKENGEDGFFCLGNPRYVQNSLMRAGMVTARFDSAMGDPVVQTVVITRKPASHV